MKLLNYIILRSAISLLIALSIQGCATPQVVKSLSTEQLKAQKFSMQTFTKYFTLIERVIENQAIKFKKDEDDALQSQITIYKKKYNSSVGKADADQNALLEELTEQVKKATEDAALARKVYDDRFKELRQKHQAILSMLDKMVIAQETLNTYIQIEKADEVIANSIFSALGTDQEKLENYGDEINRVLTGLEAIKGE